MESEIFFPLEFAAPVTGKGRMAPARTIRSQLGSNVWGKITMAIFDPATFTVAERSLASKLNDGFKHIVSHAGSLSEMDKARKGMPWCFKTVKHLAVLKTAITDRAVSVRDNGDYYDIAVYPGYGCEAVRDAVLNGDSEGNGYPLVNALRFGVRKDADNPELQVAFLVNKFMRMDNPELWHARGIGYDYCLTDWTLV